MKTEKIKFERRWAILCLVFCFFMLCETNTGFAQLVLKGRSTLKGTLIKLEKNTITVETKDGEKRVAYTRPGETGVPLEKAGVNLRNKTVIKVHGDIPGSQLAQGNWVNLTLPLTKAGKTRSEIEKLTLVSAADPEGEIKPEREAENTRDYVPCAVIARVETFRKQSLILSVPKQPFAPTGKIRCKLAKSAILQIEENNLDRCRSGDRVMGLSLIELDSGDLVAESVEIELANPVGENKLAEQKLADPKGNDLFSPRNYLKYSDQPSPPRDMRSRYFLLHTDLSERSGKMLLDKLEYMIALISRYYGRLPEGFIECYVVRDLAQWKNIPLHPDGIIKIQQKAGVTISQSLGKQRKSVVYSCDDHGVVQHEAVHAYCAQTFGSTGPTWYSEGMAEMGQYWKKGELAVDISPPVIRYLTNAPPKKMADIVAAGQITGDSWQAYAWRWALCHLLANNSNYSDRFKKLGINMMSGGKVTFQTVYGDVANEISFEYDEFVKNFGNGYRVDLCQWDWNTTPVAISGKRRLKCEINSSRGWQASRLKLNRGKKYDYACVGNWKTSKNGKEVDADGDSEGNGRLLAVIYSNYQIGKVIELGKRGTFEAPEDGHLFLRCKDDFTKLEDNRGEISVHFRRAESE